MELKAGWEREWERLWENIMLKITLLHFHARRLDTDKWKKIFLETHTVIIARKSIK
jgi:hypothetical protein